MVQKSMPPAWLRELPSLPREEGERAQSPPPGKAKALRLRCLASGAASKKEALARGSQLLKRAERAAATLEGQESGGKLERCSQQQPGGQAAGFSARC